MKIEEAIYRVKDKAANGTPSESNRIRDRRVMSAINTAYHHIIKEEIKQKCISLLKKLTSTCHA